MDRRHSGWLVIIVLLFGIAVIAATGEGFQTRPQETAETQKYKVKTELMEVRAVVTDRQNRIVENLKKEDFELLENNQPQTISFFSISEVEKEKIQPPAPGKPASARTVEIPQPPQPQSRLSEAPVRTTLLFVDNLHLSFTSLNHVKQAVRTFMNERLTDQDLVALATSSGTLGIAQQFTRERQILRYAIEQIRPGPLGHDTLFSPSLAARVIHEGSGAGSGRVVDSQPPIAGSDMTQTQQVFLSGASGNAIRLAVDIVRRENNIYCPCSTVRTFARSRALQVLTEASYARRNTLAIVRGFAEQMAGLPGKRMIVVFSDGFTMYDSSGDLKNEEVESAVSRAVRSGVVIYSINARGLQAPLTIDASRNPSTGNYDCNEPLPDPACFPPDPESLTSFVNDSEREEMNAIYSIAHETGGKLYENTNDLAGSLGQAFDENRFYYVLSYYLPAGSDPKKFRSIKVRVRNHPEYTVRAARGFAPADIAKVEEEGKTPQQHLLRAINSALPLTNLGVSARADFMERDNDDKQVSLTVYFDGDRFQYREQDLRNSVELEILSLIYDGTGKQVDGISARVEAKLTTERMDQAKTSGYRYSRRLALKPGVYQARIGVREEGTDRMGTASAWVEVPEVKPDKLEMSSLVLRNPLDTDPSSKEGINVSELEQIRMVHSIPLYDRDD
ncbi:MAG: hypothetical protein H6Q07_2719, partial [Acidobacteria bacterium]|nr:hypothetical protein [Acidobacteriota bacterium]